MANPTGAYRGLSSASGLVAGLVPGIYLLLLPGTVNLALGILSLSLGVLAGIVPWLQGRVVPQVEDAPSREAPRVQAPPVEQKQVLSVDTVPVVKSVRQLEGLASGTSDGITVLRDALGNLVTSTDKIKASQGVVRTSLTSFTSAVQGRTQDIIAMSNTIGELGKSSGQYRQGVSHLITMSGEAEGQLSKVQDSVKEISTAMGDISKFTSIIMDVADRINLLAMNASIEAAHVGAAGRGFAVIAGHVRALSEETAKNSRTINASVAQTIAIVDDTRQVTDSVLNFVKDVLTESARVASGLRDIIAHLEDLGGNSQTLVQKLDGLSAHTEQTLASLHGSEDALQSAQHDVTTLQSLLGTIADDSRGMMQEFKRLLDLVTSLQRS